MVDELGPVETPGAEIPGDFERRGTVMSDRQSYERVIEGGKMAADGCRNLEAHYPNIGWEIMAGIIDRLRAKCAELTGSYAAADTTVTPLRVTGDFLSRNDSYTRIYNGLSMMSAAARQIAACHRGDERWAKLASAIHILRDRSNELVRMKKKSILGMH